MASQKLSDKQKGGFKMAYVEEVDLSDFSECEFNTNLDFDDFDDCELLEENREKKILKSEAKIN